MPDLQNQGKIAGIFTLTIPEILNQNIIISVGFKICDKSDVSAKSQNTGL
jgi:hypothetical protein